MMRSHWIAGFVALIAMVGCGGGGSGGGDGRRTADVSGIVTDFNGNAVRDAKVWIEQFDETKSNSNGSFVLENIAEGDWKIRAEVFRDGVRYRGENVVRTFEDERARSVNITLIRESQIARVFGQVVNNQGFPVEGARVFAMAPNDGGVFSSTYDLTDSEGSFDLDTLMGGVDYRIVASGVEFNSDVDVVNVPAGDEEELVLVLKNPTDPVLPAPTGLEAVSWVSPREETRSRGSDAAYQNLKRLFDPRTPSRTSTRDTNDGNWVEVDLFWDPYPNEDSHIGFGIYRRFGTVGDFFATDFLRDPEAEIYIDLDSELLEFDTVGYLITAINTNYPDTSNSESESSNSVTVETLDDLFLNPVAQGPLRFRWQAGSGAEEFIVYLFDEYPGIGVGSIWDNAASPATGTEAQYTGSSLQSGRRYYYMVLGVANSQTSRTISRVGVFVAN
jgi:hypothetical protein